MRTAFLGIGGYLPPRVVSNDELAEMMETSNEWIVERTGIRTRHWIDRECGASDLAVPASRQALADAGVAPEEIDCIILATLSPDHTFPGTACFLQEKLGLKGIPALDIRNQCSGFIYSLAVADAFIKTGQYRRILLVGAEVHSTGLDKTTRGRDVACLFGDGAGAAVLGPCEETERGVLSTHLHADGRYARELWIEVPGSRFFPQRLDVAMVEQGRHFPRMNGRRVFVEAVRRMPEVIGEALAANSLSVDDIDLFVPHQANQRITEAVAKQIGMPAEKVFSNIDKVGNTTAASIPLCLRDACLQGKLQRRHLVLLASFGAGFTWAAALLRW